MSRKTQHIAKQYIKNKLDRYLMICLNMNYIFISLIIWTDHVFININRMQCLIFEK